MATDNQTTIQASLVSDLVKMFFKGMGNILDMAAEYQQEMGVLKSITEIPVADTSGDEYTLVIKLSPVKDKDSVYYVEALAKDADGKETNQFDLKQLNEQAFKIDKTSMNEFNKLIQTVLRKNKLTRIDPVEEETDVTELECCRIDDPDDIVVVTVTRHPVKEKDNMYVLDIDTDKPVDKPYSSDKTYNEDGIEKQITLFLDDNDLVEVDEDEEDGLDVEDEADEYSVDLGDNVDVNESTKISVTLRKIGASSDVELTAVKASCDLVTADNLISSLVYQSHLLDDVEPDQEVSYEITEDDDVCVVDEIDNVDTSGTCVALYNYAQNAEANLRAISWKLTGLEDSAVSSALENIFWEIRYMTDSLGRMCWLHDSVAMNPGLVTYNAIDVSTIDTVDAAIDAAVDVIKPLVEALQFYFPNLSASDQQSLSSGLANAESFIERAAHRLD